MNESPVPKDPLEVDNEKVRTTLENWGFSESEQTQILTTEAHFQIVLNIRAKLERLGHKTAEAQIIWFPETDTYSGLRDGRPLRKALLDGDAKTVLTLLERICGS